MPPFPIVTLLLAGVLFVGTPFSHLAGALMAMAASPFDGSRRIIAIVAVSADLPPVREQSGELMKHVAGLDERDIVVFIALPDGGVEKVHGPTPTPAEARAFFNRNPLPTAHSASHFTVLLVGKDGGVKFRSDRPVPAEQLFALIDTMPMRRQEMKRPGLTGAGR